MVKIMFVCHGNICRSPMAEFIYKDIIKKNGRESDFSVFSSATSTEEIYRGVGNPVYPPARRELEIHGISCAGKRAVLLTRTDAEKYDLFVGMDSANIRNMHAILGDSASDRIYKLLSFAGRSDDVSDPWYSDRFDIAYRDIYEGCVALYNKLVSD